MIRTWIVANMLMTGAVMAESLLEPGAQIVEAGGGFRFTEGPACDRNGAIWFTDIPNNAIHRWSASEGLTRWITNSGGANGLYFDAQGRLLACAGERRALVAYDTSTAESSVLADTFGGQPFNKPNDLWVSPSGGIYFSDPNYRKDTSTQDREGVYHRAPDGTIQRVIDDFTRPNGLIGTPDGTRLYATDIAAKQTWSYDIEADGRLSGKRLLCTYGSDGMTLDEQGNVYLTEAAVLVFSPTGEKIEEIAVPRRPANVTFGGPDRRTLFITARESVYTLRMRVRGAPGVVEAVRP